MRLSYATVLIFLIAVFAAGTAPAQTQAQAPRVELLISGPQTLKLLARGETVHFTAVLINHSTSPVLFVPPHPDWPDERWTMWQAFDEKGRFVETVPQEFIWCDPHGTMRAQYVLPMSTLSGPKDIRDSDLVLLQPGESYELPHVGDPRLYLKFPHPGKYHLSLAYGFQPSHYRLPAGSLRSAALLQAAQLSLISSSLDITLN